MMSSLLSHPINPALLLCLLYALRRILFPITAVPRTLPTECKAGYSWMPRKHTPTLRFTTYTPRTLAKVLFAIAGIVFDVTGGKGFYGPDGMYWRVAGRDASRSVAKQSFGPEPLTPIDQPLDKLEDLSPRERENMRSWSEHFMNRYVICGRLVDNDAEEL
ncbi:cytochrome b5 [Russula aff. rugulosa BPL654]|nr:cytochrome b5 [Russula aff. rugulosa BPL654]